MAGRRVSPGWLAAAAVVFLGDLFLHLPVTDFCDWLATRYGFSEYDYAVRMGFIAAGVIGYAVIWLWPGRHRTAFGMAATVLLGLTIVAHKLIVVNAVETIHYPQYALLMVLLARGLANLELSWIAATLLGALDEGYQAVALSRGAPDYFDWNDVVLNGIGAALGTLVVLAFIRAAGRHPTERFWNTKWATLTTGLALAAYFDPPVWSPFFEATPGGRLFHRLAASEALFVLTFVYGLILALQYRVTERK
ncbi:MAG TPA: hypothetical protein VES67_03610 [Vicinamibacterales bacterium]|nr:hypothetical protein [Vicinamibacterales bacterium]